MGALDNKTILFSGLFAGHERSDLEKQATAAGARLLSGVSKNLNYLVAGEKMGPDKKKKAEELGVPIISIQDFFDMEGGPPQAAPKAEAKPLPKIEAVNIGDTICPHSIMDGRTAYIAFSSREKTPHRFAPPTKDVFVKFNKNHKEKILPLFELDLHELNPGYTDKVYFIYYESISYDWIVYSLDAQSKITDIQLTDRDTVSKVEDENVEEFGQGYEGTMDTIDDYKKENGKYIRIAAVAMPEGTREFKANDKEEYKRYTKALDAITDLPEYNQGWHSNEIGPYPVIVQNGFSYPVLPGSETPFLYVGGIATSSETFGGLIDTMLYLYYHPEERIVAQFMQMT